MKRRTFISLLGGTAAAWPLVARAQLPAMPVIGFLHSQSPGSSFPSETAFRQGLKEAGYVEGENVHIAFRWAEGQNNRLPGLAADLVARRVTVIVAAGGGPSVMAAKVATTTIPIVFVFGGDPVKANTVTSFNRPGGNMTGVRFFSTGLGAKRLELLSQLAPNIPTVALLLNPNNPEATPQPSDFEEAARRLGRQFHVLNASSEAEIDTAFAALVERRAALFVGNDPFLTSRRVQLVHLASHHRIPTTYSARESAHAGGLMSYGTSQTDAYRQVGVYTGRILKGAKPADLPVAQATKFELVINLKTAKILGLTAPAELLVAADEVIE